MTPPTPRKAVRVFTCPTETQDLTGTCRLCGEGIDGHDLDYRCMHTPPPTHTPKGTYMALPLSNGSSTITDQNDIQIFSMATDRIWESDRDYIVTCVNAHEELVQALKNIIKSSPNNNVYEIAWKALSRAEGSR